MKTEIITIGDELLIGQTADTNSQWMARHLSNHGIQVTRITSLPDQLEVIVEAFGQAAGRSDAVVITGGLGPTRDDVTRQAITRFFEVEWRINADVYRRLKNYFAQRGYKVSNLNRDQAKTPDGARVFVNRVGTAPAMGLEKQGCWFYFLPGVPPEMRALMMSSILPELSSREESKHYLYNIILTQGLPEAHLAEKLKDYEQQLPRHLMLAYLPGEGLVRLRLSGRDADHNRLKGDLEQWLARLKELIHPYIVHVGDEPLERLIGRLLVERQQSLATGESCTGGIIAGLITSVAGSSRYFKGSVVAYSNQVKMSMLKVSAKTLEQHGAVSQQVVEEMARGTRKTFGSDYAVSVSGIAGPGGGTAQKGVGTTWIAVTGPDAKMQTRLYHFGHNRELNIRKTANTALVMLKRLISDEI